MNMTHEILARLVTHERTQLGRVTKFIDPVTRHVYTAAQVIAASSAGSPIVQIDCTCGVSFFCEADWLIHRAAFPEHHPA